MVVKYPIGRKSLPGESKTSWLVLFTILIASVFIVSFTGLKDPREKPGWSTTHFLDYPLPPPNLVAEYGFNEGTGTVLGDNSGNNLNGILNGPTWSTSGKYGSALSFDGTNDLVNIADASLLDLTRNMTLEAWIYPTNLTSYKTVLCKENGSNNFIYTLAANNNATNTTSQRPDARMANGTYVVTATGTTKLSTNTWTHLAATYDGSIFRFYVNGVQVATTSINGQMGVSSGMLRIGGTTTLGNQYFAGLIDEVRIYSRALSASEIQTDMNTPVAAPGNPADDVVPTVTLTSPLTGSVSGTVNATATASDNTGIAGVQFYIDGNPLGAEDTQAPYSVPWNTTTLNNGTYAVTARARDAAGNTTFSEETVVNVNNDKTAPTVSITEPAAGTVTGTLNVSANAADNVGVSGVQFLLDGNTFGAEDTQAPYSISWNTTTASGGNHTLSARARDAAGNTTMSSSVAVTVNNPVSNTNLVASYGFNENGGAVLTDFSGRNNNGTLANGPVWTTSGKYGGALSFDGTNDLVNIADASSLDLTNGMTIEAWVNSNNLTGYKTVLCKENGTNNFVYTLAANNGATTATSQRPDARMANGTYVVTVTGTTKLPVNTWTHLAATYDGSVFRYYVNGTQVATTSINGQMGVSTGMLRLGGTTTLGNQYFSGLIDEVRIYNRALTASEIQTDMNTPIQTPPVSRDETAPVVSLTAPAAGTVSGTVNVTADASDNVAVTSVQFLLDDVALGPEDIQEPYLFSWNTTTTSNGNHTLKAVAKDAAGNTTTTNGLIITVNNIPDTEAPAVEISSPTGGNVSGVITINATANDNIGVTGVQFLLDGANLNGEDTQAPYSITWNSGLVINGPHTLSARAKDAAGNVKTSATVNINVDNGNLPVISAITTSSISATSAVISWTTNVPASSQVIYGPTTSYNFSTLVDSSLIQSHSMTINDLVPGRLYHYQVLSGEVNGNTAVSQDITFTTDNNGSNLGTLNSHTVRSDNGGKIIPWTQNPGFGYDTVMYLAWNYLLHSVPNDPATGKPAYYSQSYINPNTQVVSNWPHNPAGTFAMLIESALKYYQYSGNAGVMQIAKDIGLWHINNGRTSSTDNWPSVPYASGDAGTLTYNGANVGNSNGVGDGDGILQPDKIGELAHAWILLYEFDGDVRFRDAAIQSANVLSSKIRPGTNNQSPWPYRVNARTGAIREEYCAHTIAPIRLFDELIRLGLGDTAAYRTARNTAWSWMMTYPMQNNIWSQYFEDVGIQSSYSNNLNQYVAGMAARYLIEHPEFDPNWEAHVRGIINWIEQKFGEPSFGATAINEQITFHFIMGSHTSRYASLNALLYEKTGDLAAKEKAYRSFNWATYMCRPTGVVLDGPEVNNEWFTDGYGDYVRHFMTGLGAIPEWSPTNQTHLLRSTSIVKNISYGSNTVDYTTYDGDATEVLHVSFNPATITANGVVLPKRNDLSQPGWTLDVATKTLRIHHSGATQISISAAQPPFIP